MLRIGKRCVVSFPNFIQWRPMLQMMITGRTPVTRNLPFRWFNTPNSHYLTIRDFRAYCRQNRIRVLQFIPLIEGRRSPIRWFPSVRAAEAIFVIARKW
jgi:methionine biosynthesis protein MetW